MGFTAGHLIFVRADKPSPGYRVTACAPLRTRRLASSDGVMTANEVERVFGIAAAYFALMADATRLKILHAVCHEEKPRAQISVEIGAPIADVKRHLRAMARCGIVTRRTARKQSFYKASDAAMVELCRTICGQVGQRLAGRQREPAGARADRIAAS
jgi:DNA-binding transcriptional ArsR family regulator